MTQRLGTACVGPILTPVPSMPFPQPPSSGEVCTRQGKNPTVRKRRPHTTVGMLEGDLGGARGPGG